MQKRLLHVTLAAMLAAGTTLAQQPAPAPASAPAPAGGAAATKTFSQQDLDTLLAPIALYPDALLAQILMASTYPLEIVEAARWLGANPSVKGDALTAAMEKQAWDPSVKAITAVPKVVEHMSEKLEWTQKLGDAFLAQQTEVMVTVQALRAKAAAAGNLKGTSDVVVKTEQVESKTVYVIESAKPEVVYVPTYNPSTIYGAWPYPAPPYYMYPPAYVYPPGLAFATGVVVGAAIWGNANWGGNNVNINVNNYNKVNATKIQNSNFQHNAEHRKGVAYQNQGVANQNGRGTSAQASQARSQYGGHDSAGSRQGGGASASNYGGGGSANRASPSASSTGSRGGGFEGAGGSRASTQAASARGSASRGGGGASRGGGGGRRR